MSHEPPALASIESLARQAPSRALAPPAASRREVCGCCRACRERACEHPALGPLCRWCALAFDHRLDRFGVPVPERELCPACLEQGAPCELHGRWD